MLCETEFLAVGEGGCAGDAMVVRFAELNHYKLRRFSAHVSRRNAVVFLPCQVEPEWISFFSTED
jgi:hypothetical protein